MRMENQGKMDGWYKQRILGGEEMEEGKWRGKDEEETDNGDLYHTCVALIGVGTEDYLLLVGRCGIVSYPH